MKKLSILATAAVAAIVAAAPAAAVTYTVPLSPSTITTLPTYPTTATQQVSGPDNALVAYYSFTLAPQAGNAMLSANFNSTSPAIQFSGIQFYTGTPGALTPVDGVVIDSNSSPTGTGGTNISFSNRMIGAGTYTIGVTGTTSAATSLGASIGFTPTAVPEAATWAMMLVGFGGVGGALRSSRRKVSFA